MTLADEAVVDASASASSFSGFSTSSSTDSSPSAGSVAAGLSEELPDQTAGPGHWRVSYVSDAHEEKARKDAHSVRVELLVNIDGEAWVVIRVCAWEGYQIAGNWQASTGRGQVDLNALGIDLSAAGLLCLRVTVSLVRCS